MRLCEKSVLSSSADHTSYISNLTRTSISSQIDNKYSTTILKIADILNTDDIYSCVTPQKQNYSGQATYTTPPRLTPLITNLPISPVEFKKHRNYPQLVNNICVSRLTENLLMLINVSNQEYQIKPLISSYIFTHLKNIVLGLNDMKTIGIYRSSLTGYSFEHRCMNKIKKKYQHAGKFDDQQDIKDIIDATLLSTP